MPTPDELAAQYQARQQAVKAAAMRQAFRLFPQWELEDEDSFETLLIALALLTRLRRRDSIRFAWDYYAARRFAEDVRQHFPKPGDLAVERDPNLAGGLVLSGPIQAKKAIGRGVDPAKAKADAHVRIAEVIARSVHNAGRETLQIAAEKDPVAKGFRRVVNPNACDYCRSFAGRVYPKRPNSGGFHNHCDCQIEPVFR